MDRIEWNKVGLWLSNRYFVMAKVYNDDVDVGLQEAVRVDFSENFASIWFIFQTQGARDQKVPSNGNKLFDKREAVYLLAAWMLTGIRNTGRQTIFGCITQRQAWATIKSLHGRFRKRRALCMGLIRCKIDFHPFWKQFWLRSLLCSPSEHKTNGRQRKWVNNSYRSQKWKAEKIVGKWLDKFVPSLGLECFWHTHI